MSKLTQQKFREAAVRGASAMIGFRPVCVDTIKTLYRNYLNDEISIIQASMELANDTAFHDYCWDGWVTPSKTAIKTLTFQLRKKRRTFKSPSYRKFQKLIGGL